MCGRTRRNGSLKTSMLWKPLVSRRHPFNADCLIPILSTRTGTQLLRPACGCSVGAFWKLVLSGKPCASHCGCPQFDLVCVLAWANQIHPQVAWRRHVLQYAATLRGAAISSLGFRSFFVEITWTVRIPSQPYWRSKSQAGRSRESGHLKWPAF